MSLVVSAVVVGTAVTIYGQHQQGKAAEATAKYNAKLAENEAIAKEQQAHVESQQMQKQKERLIASQRAGFAKGGAMITEGTPLLLMAEQAGQAELDILQNQRNRAMEGTSLLAQAEMEKWQGKQAKRASQIGMVGTVLGGIGGVAGAKANAKGNASAGKAAKNRNANMQANASLMSKYGTK